MAPPMPIASRTRRRREQDLMNRYREWKGRQESGDTSVGGSSRSFSASVSDSPARRCPMVEPSVSSVVAVSSDGKDETDCSSDSASVPAHVPIPGDKDKVRGRGSSASAHVPVPEDRSRGSSACGRVPVLENLSRGSSSAAARVPVPEHKSRGSSASASVHVPIPKDRRRGSAASPRVSASEDKIRGSSTSAPAHVPVPEDKTGASSAPAHVPVPEDKTGASSAPAHVPVSEDKTRASSSPAHVPAPEDKTRASSALAHVPVPEDKTRWKAGVPVPEDKNKGKEKVEVKVEEQEDEEESDDDELCFVGETSGVDPKKSFDRPILVGCSSDDSEDTVATEDRYFLTSSSGSDAGSDSDYVVEGLNNEVCGNYDSCTSSNSNTTSSSSGDSGGHDRRVSSRKRRRSGQGKGQKSGDDWRVRRKSRRSRLKKKPNVDVEPIVIHAGHDGKVSRKSGHSGSKIPLSAKLAQLDVETIVIEEDSDHDDIISRKSGNSGSETPLSAQQVQEDVEPVVVRADIDHDGNVEKPLSPKYVEVDMEPIVIRADSGPDAKVSRKPRHSGKRKQTEIGNSHEDVADTGVPSLPRSRHHIKKLKVDDDDEEEGRVSRLRLRNRHHGGDSSSDDNEICERMARVGIQRGEKKRNGFLGFKYGSCKTLTNVQIHEILVNSLSPDGEKDQLDELFKGEESVTHSDYEQDVEDISDQEEEDELAPLWKELEMCLAACLIGATDTDMVKEDPSVDNQGTCQQGKHYLILNDELGIICKYCSHLETEIRHVRESFYKHPFGISGRRGSFYAHHSGQDARPGLEDLGCDSSQLTKEPAFRPTGTVWDLIPGIGVGMYPHQKEGFEFLWRSVAGDIILSKLNERHQKYGKGGCIISHAPGTGKTRLAISFLQSYLKLYNDSRPIIIAPRSLLNTWDKEFKTWNAEVPFHNLNDSDLTGKEDPRLLCLLANRKPTSEMVRLIKLKSWLKGESVLGISYRVFEQLAGEKPDQENSKKDFQVDDKISKVLLNQPGLLVLDEGHTPRNDSSKIFKALSNVDTDKRIILSGTPFQNNFNELYNTLCLVQPSFVDCVNPGRFMQRRGRKNKDAGKGAFTSLARDDNNSTGIEELRALMKPFVNIHRGSILRETLPGRKDFVVTLQMPDCQKVLFEKAEQATFLESDYLVSLLSVHPTLVCPGNFEHEELKPEDSTSRCRFYAELLPEEKDRLRSLKSRPLAGLKARFVTELVRLSKSLGERVLVFGQFIDPLLFLVDALSSHFGWRDGTEILHMTGKLPNKKRQSIMDSFNDPRSEAVVLLASTKACSEGIKLVGASRVVFLDVVWNPSVEKQAVSRAYRIGQKRMVYVYRLITSNTREANKYRRQMRKDQLSELVFCGGKGGLSTELAAQASPADNILEIMIGHPELKSLFEEISHPSKFDSDLIDGSPF